MNKFGILAWPAYITKPGNPYNYLIYSKIENMGYPVYEFDFSLMNIIKFGFSAKYKILHFHWPTALLTFASPIQIRIRLALLQFFLLSIKLLKKKVVWTVHNFQSHETTNSELEQQLYNILYRYVDGFISLNKGGLETIKSSALNRENQLFEYIPHPHYKGYYPDTISKSDARAKLNISDDKFVFLFLGQIRKYKNIDGLISAFRELDVDNKFLLIAGTAYRKEDAMFKANIKGVEDILFVESFIKDEDLQLYLNSCDLVVTPYKNILNSGSVFLNLSFNKPTLAPDIGIFPQLYEELGTNLIKLYPGDICNTVLENAMDGVKKENDQSGIQSFDITVYDPERVALKTLEFYKSLLPKQL